MKTMYILRGVSGSGKSTLAKNLAEAEHREAASKTPGQLRAELAALEEK